MIATKERAQGAMLSTDVAEESNGCAVSTSLLADLGRSVSHLQQDQLELYTAVLGGFDAKEALAAFIALRDGQAS